jgi:hypothetical protein
MVNDTNSVKTKKRKKRRKTKPKAEEVSSVMKQEEFIEMLKERKGIVERIADINSVLVKIIPRDNFEEWQHKLPLHTLSELDNYEAGIKGVSNLEALKLKSKFRKDRLDEIEKLNAINSEILINRVDLLLEKIDKFDKDLD